MSSVKRFQMCKQALAWRNAVAVFMLTAGDFFIIIFNE